MGQRVRWQTRDRVVNHARFTTFDQVNLRGLSLYGQVSVQNADTTLAGHRDCHAGLGDGVHCARNQGHFDRDIPGDLG